MPQWLVMRHLITGWSLTILHTCWIRQTLYLLNLSAVSQIESNYLQIIKILCKCFDDSTHLSPGVQYGIISSTDNMSCVELRNIFMEKKKKISNNHLEDYDYCKLLYENAKNKKYSQRSNRSGSQEENRFENIYMFLRDMESGGAFQELETDSTNYYQSYQFNSWEERSRRQHEVHSAQNSDYSFWSLDEFSSSSSFLSESTSQYSDLLRLQSRHLYVQF